MFHVDQNDPRSDDHEYITTGHKKAFLKYLFDNCI